MKQRKTVLTSPDVISIPPPLQTYTQGEIYYLSTYMQRHNTVTPCPVMEFLDNKKLESFTPCYLQSLLLANFKENHTLLWF
jgi:hypothetical protein